MADPIPRLTIALSDRYRIERELGAGGMATVYLRPGHGSDGRFLMVRPRPDLRPRTELVMLERWTDVLPR